MAEGPAGDKEREEKRVAVETEISKESKTPVEQAFDDFYQIHTFPARAEEVVFGRYSRADIHCALVRLCNEYAVG